VMAAVGVAGWFGAKAYKRTSERRLVSRGRDFLAKKDFRQANLSLKRALELNPVSANANEAMADLMETVGDPSALNWRIRAASLDSKDAGKRFRWAELAVKENDLKSAGDALDGLDEVSRNTTEYHKLKGALAWSRRDAADAEQEYLAAAQLDPGNLAVQMNLATIRMESTNEAVAQAARASLQQISTNATLHLNALRQLLADAVIHKSAAQVLRYSSQIANDPAANFSDKIGYVELLRQNQSTEYSAWLTAVEKDGRLSVENAVALGRWKVITSGPTNAFHWLASLSPQIQTNLPVSLLMTDCQIALKDWKGILGKVEKQDWADANYYKLALQSLAERSLSQNAAADASWHKAVRAASHRLENLSRLAEVARVWDWHSERSELLTEIIDEFPEQSWAIDELASQLYAEGKTSEMVKLFHEAYAKDPSNPRLKNNLANLYLLRKTDLDKAYTLAKEAYFTSTNNPFYASTYAYSLLLQDKKREALNVVSVLKPEFLKIPSVSLYYGVVQAQSGQKEAAREALKRAGAGKLLPEERAMIQIAESRM